jgi:hypothetical protein
MLPAAVVALSSLAVAPSGCAAVVGVEDFTVEGEGPGATTSTGTSMEISCDKVHDCDRMTATNYTVMAGGTVYVSFNATGYNPPCIRILNGVNVTFNSSTHSFVDIPLAGGISPDVDPGSDIKEVSTSAKDATFEIAGEECVYPFFSPKFPETHTGAVFIGGSGSK